MSSKVWKRYSWLVPSSNEDLMNAEAQLMKNVKSEYTSKYVDLGKGRKIWTRVFNQENNNNNFPLVLIHGLGGGQAMWFRNYDELCRDRIVYAFDVLGFGRSTRTNISKDIYQAQDEMVQFLEDWRKANEIDEMILLCHSSGAYLGTWYTLKHPDHIQQLIFADPWGFMGYSKDSSFREFFPPKIRFAMRKINMTPFFALRAAGPLGPSLFRKITVHKKENNQNKKTEKAIADYFYHCNVQKPTGEIYALVITHRAGFAKLPLIERIIFLPAGLPIDFIYGSESAIDKRGGEFVKRLLPNNKVNVHIVEKAGHQLYIQQADQFNNLVNKICRDVDAYL